MIFLFLSAIFFILCFVLVFVAFFFQFELLHEKSSDLWTSITRSHLQEIYAADGNSSEKKGLVPTEAGIHVNSYPIGIAINPLLKHIYVTNQFSNTLSIINSDNGRLLRTVQLDSSPYGIDNDIITNRIYTAIIGDDSLAIIDGTTGKLIHKIQRNVKTPVDVKVIPNQDLLYVTNIDNNTVSKFSTISNNIKQIIPVGQSPYSLGSYQRSDNNNYIFVTNLRDGLINVILMNNTKQKDSSFTSDKIIANISIGGIPVGIGVNDVTNKIYVTNIQNNTVSIINITKDDKYEVIKTICSGYFDDQYLTQVNYQSTENIDKCDPVNPTGIYIDKEKNIIYVSNVKSSKISVINGTTDIIEKEILINLQTNEYLDRFIKESGQSKSNQFPNIASFMDFDVLTKTLYVTNTASNSISVVNSTSKKLDVGLQTNIHPPNSGRIVCSSDTSNDTISIDHSSFIRFPFGSQLNCVAYPGVSYDFSYWSGNISNNSIEKDQAQVVEFLNSFIFWFRDLFVDEESPKLNFTMTKYGTALTANFKEGSTISEYLNVLLIPIIFLAAIPGLKWVLKKYRQRKKTYLTKRKMVIDDAYKESQNNPEESLYRLRQIRNEIIKDFFNGHITEKDYKEWMNQISKYIIAINGEEL